MSIVRDNLMNREGYAPYCGVGTCMHRMTFNGKQFTCPTHASYVTEFPADFIAAYKTKWGK